jgi:glutathione S-transferase
MPPRITLFTFLPSQNAVRAEIALIEKGLDFERVEVDLFAGEHRNAPLIDVNPRGQVPALRWDGGDGAIDLYESIAIIRFLDDMHPDPPLMPPVSEPAARAAALMRIEEFQAKLDPRNIFGSVVFGKQSREQLGKRVDDLVAELPRWDAYVQGRDYLAGDRFTLADIAVFPLLMHFDLLGYDFAARTPALAAWMERCRKRPSVVATGWVEGFERFFSRDGMRPARVLAD